MLSTLSSAASWAQMSTMALGDSIGHSVQHGTQGSYSKVSGVRDIITDPGCVRAKDPDMAHCSSLSLDDTMAPDDSADLSDHHGPGCSMTLGHHHGHRLQPRPRVSMCHLVATWVTDINT